MSEREMRRVLSQVQFTFYSKSVWTFTETLKLEWDVQWLQHNSRSHTARENCKSLDNYTVRSQLLWLSSFSKESASRHDTLKEHCVKLVFRKGSSQTAWHFNNYRYSGSHSVPSHLNFPNPHSNTGSVVRDEKIANQVLAVAMHV